MDSSGSDSVRTASQSSSMAFAHPHIPHAVAKYLKNAQVAPPAPRHNNLSPERIQKLRHLKDMEDYKWRHDRVKEYLVQKIKNSPQKAKLHTEAGAKLVEETVESVVEDISLVFKVSW